MPAEHLNKPAGARAGRGGWEGTLRLYAGVSIFAFLVTGIAYLVLGRWPVTHQDFWRIYDTCLHRSWWASALLKYNGHSHFFPSQFWLADLRFFHGSQDFLFASGLFFQVLGTVLLLFPVWRDQRLDFSTRILSTMVLTVFTFWMGRASMTASGGFNCCYSLTLTGSALAFLILGEPGQESRRWSVGLAWMVLGGILATFSFGTGLAIWPAIFAIGYGLRISSKTLLGIAIAGVAAFTMFSLLPSREPPSAFIHAGELSQLSTYLTLANYFFHMLGTPLVEMAAAWPAARSFSPGLSGVLAVILGAAGASTAVVILIWKCVRRTLNRGLESIAFGLMTFNLVAFGLITLARAHHIASIPTELDAPRYYYWSSLFWAGLVLSGLAMARAGHYLRLPVVCTALILPVFIGPSHFHEGQKWRYVRLISSEAATSLINGVQDPSEVKILSPYPDLVFRLARVMRSRKLDMFAAGYQEWLGQPADKIFQSRQRARFRGKVQAQLLPLKPPACRIASYAIHRHGTVPEISITTNSHGIINGVARSVWTPPWLNALLYGGIFRGHKSIGFVAAYDPRDQYWVRSVEGTACSTEAIRVPLAVRTIGSGR